MTSFIPRADRFLVLAHRAADAEKARGGNAMEQAFASIEGGCGKAAKINHFKCDVEAVLKVGARHPRTKARYRPQINRLVEMMPNVQSLNMACVIVDAWYRGERRDLQLMTLFGRTPSFRFMVLREQRLILRWLRFKRLHAEFPDILAELAAPVARPQLVEAAE